MHLYLAWKFRLYTYHKYYVYNFCEGARDGMYPYKRTTVCVCECVWIAIDTKANQITLRAVALPLNAHERPKLLRKRIQRIKS